MSEESLMLKREHKSKKKKKRTLRKQTRQGLPEPTSSTIPNHNCQWKEPAEEKVARQETVEQTIQAIRPLLVGLLSDLSDIPDPRNPRKIKHKLTVLMVYGIFSFVFQFASRREAGREMSRPTFYENLRLCFPELESLPHQDTLGRLLERIEVEDMEYAHIKLLKRLIRNKKFCHHLVKKQYLVAIDGTQKFTCDTSMSEKSQHRKVKGTEDHQQHYVYVLEAKLIFANGMVLPLMSEFLDNTAEEMQNKQDCELKAFYRLVPRLKAQFPQLSITLLLDGLYANGPVLSLCKKNKWSYMIVLKDDTLKQVWKEANALHKLDAERERTYERSWKNRQQQFWWVNDIEYTYGPNDKYKQTIHAVVCEESWEEVDDDTGEVITKTSRHAWISSEPLQQKNIHERCNLMARARWSLENDILKEKRQGYQYEHVFSEDWHAMKGYHYLMHLGHLLNELAQHSVVLVEKVHEWGIRGFIRLLRETMSGPWLDHDRIRKWLQKRHSLRLAC
jgi:hypothetical protein